MASDEPEQEDSESSSSSDSDSDGDSEYEDELLTGKKRMRNQISESFSSESVGLTQLW